MKSVYVNISRMSEAEHYHVYGYLLNKSEGHRPEAYVSKTSYKHLGIDQYGNLEYWNDPENFGLDARALASSEYMEISGKKQSTEQLDRIEAKLDRLLKILDGDEL